ncbi:Calcium-binding acidic-repeat protein precursor (ARP) [hydrothermal vent metagenome]|uniref:Calcium-binding acidic-repeat protein (ARP) n=1 Tax=hydrothermal vent metagenome TaxID=652676 RepID=A0A1W1CMA7_9ZZZZ
MRTLKIIILFFIMVLTVEARTVYFDGENGKVDEWIAQEEGVINNIYNQELDSRVASFAPGTYDIGLRDRSWNNETERVLSWNMNITGRYTIFVSVNTLQGHRWLFYNNLNVDVGFHNGGILNGIGARVNNGRWQKVTVDLDRELQDTEPNNRITSVDGVRFAGTLGMIDNVTLDTPNRVTYEDGERGIANWRVTDNTPNNATVSVLFDNEEVRLNGETRGEQRVPPFDYAYNDNVISLNGDGENNEFTIGAVNGDNAWNDTTHNLLQCKIRNSEHFTMTVHILTEEGEKRLIYAPRGANRISDDGLEIYHSLARSRNGDGTHYGAGTDGRWQTYTLDLAENLLDYDPDNRLIAVNGISFRGSMLIDDIELLDSTEPNGPIPSTGTVMEDAEDETIDGWRVHNGIGSIDDIVNVYDAQRGSRVIQLTGGGSYILGGLNTQSGWNHTMDTTISWKMNSANPYTIFIAVDTLFGMRHIFYTFSPNRGLLHGFETGLHHGLGASSASGRWRTITRDLERDLKDAEPENEIIAVNGFIYNGGDNGMIDDIILYTPQETIIEDGESGIDKWVVSDATPNGATITNIADNDRQGRHLQGNVISFQGSGADNAYRLDGINSQNQKLLQWRFRGFGGELEILSANPDERGTIRDPEAFEFRVSVDTADGARDLTYTLGAVNRGLIEGGTTIHHGLGDDRIRGSIWAGDDPMNEMGLWQTITRDLEEDIRDFEPNNRLLSINSFEVRNSGLVDDIKLLSSAPINDDNDSNVTVYEDAENGNIEGWQVYDNDPTGATITNVADEVRGGRVIELNGNGLNNGFELGRRRGDGQWNNRDHNSIRWSMNYSEAFAIYVAIETEDGARYMKYEPRDDNGGRVGNYIQIGLGEGITTGTWRTFSRNLENDLRQFEPANRLVAIHAFLIRGSGRLDDIETFQDEVDDIENIIYEDAEDGNSDGWSIYDNSSGTATINNVIDNDRESRVIELQGHGRADGYMLGGLWGADMWNNRVHNSIRWSMNYNEEFTLYISVRTTNGHRYLLYTARDDDRGLNGEYIRIGLGADANDGTWREFSRNLAEDISTFEAGNELVSVDGFLIRGSGRLDDIVMF